MELKDVKTILNRIKVNYPTFINDDFTRSEWYNELKDYSLNDVMEKLEQHFRSEQYGNSIPKVYFLTKYLTKEKDKENIKTYTVACSKCGEHVTSDKIEEHYDRCGSVEFLTINSKKYLSKSLNRQKLMEADEKTFKDYYYKTVEEILPLIDDNPMKKKCFENILHRHYTGESKYTVKELLS